MIIDEYLVNFKELFPSYAILNEDKTFSSLWTDLDEDLNKFINNSNIDNSLYSDLGKMNPKSNKKDVFPVSMIPGINFTSFNLNLKNNSNYLTTIFTFGKFENKAAK